MSTIALVIWISALRRRRVAGGVVVHQDERGGRQFQRAFDHFARIDRGVVERAGLLYFVSDQLVALVEEQDAKLLLVGERHAGAAIADHVVPGRQRDAALDLAFCNTLGGGGEQLELGD